MSFVSPVFTLGVPMSRPIIVYRVSAGLYACPPSMATSAARPVERSVVKAVRFDRKSAWAQLDLEDNEQVSLHALQSADKDYAVAFAIPVNTVKADLAKLRAGSQS